MLVMIALRTLLAYVYSRIHLLIRNQGTKLFYENYFLVFNNFTEIPFSFFLCYLAWVNHFQLFTKCMHEDFKNKNYKNKSACVWGGFECFSFLCFFFWKIFSGNLPDDFFSSSKSFLVCAYIYPPTPSPSPKTKQVTLLQEESDFVFDYESWKNWESFLRLESI